MFFRQRINTRFISILLLVGLLLGNFQASAESLLAPLTISDTVRLPDFTKLVEEHSKAVVNISTSQKERFGQKSPHDFNGGSDRNEIIDDLMRRFFEPPGNASPHGPSDKDVSSLGSGFIISEDGYIITNHHVIAGADEIIVRLSDRRELVAKVIGSDKRSDVALLKVEAKNLPILETGSSKNLKVGEWVVAIGSPFGFDHSVTAGIVSAKGRSLPSENYIPFIQTDVAINPGNSGGPLFNLKGEVVGINSQIYSRTGGFMGVSFAIPVDVAKRVVEQLKSKGKVSRGWLGVFIQEITPDLATSFGLKSPKGALIVEVMKEGPAKGILQQGDIVIKFDGKEINDASDLPVIVGSTEINKSVDIIVRRAGKIKTLALKLAELPTTEELNRKKPRKKPVKPKKRDQIFGMEVVELNKVAREALGIEGGVLVKSVKGNPAFKAGVEPGDVLLRLNGEKIKSYEHFQKIASSLKAGKMYSLLISRNDSRKYLALRMSD